MTPGLTFSGWRWIWALPGLPASFGTFIRAPCIGEIDRQNPQVRFGADILTRIQVAENPEGLRELRDCVVEEINRAMAYLCRGAFPVFP